MDPITAFLAITAAAIIFDTGGADQPQGIATCETVDQGGYLTYADPTCPAQYIAQGDTVLAEIVED